MNLQLFQFFHSFTGQYWLIDWLFVFLGKHLPYFIAVGFILVIFWTYKIWQDRLYFAFLSLLALLLSRGVLAEIIRFFYYSPRPFKALNFESLIKLADVSSMPSGHATIFFALAVLMSFINKNYFWYFLAGAVLVGLGRVFAGVHWPADILVGAAIGISGSLLAKYILPYNDKEKS